MKVWHITPDVGYGGNLLYNLTNNAKRIPEPLPWIDPSINCLYKEAVLSFMIGNYESSITNLCLLMEHVLRAAILNDKDYIFTEKINWTLANIEQNLNKFDNNNLFDVEECIKDLIIPLE